MAGTRPHVTINPLMTPSPSPSAQPSRIPSNRLVPGCCLNRLAATKAAKPTTEPTERSTFLVRITSVSPMATIARIEMESRICTRLESVKDSGTCTPTTTTISRRTPSKPSSRTRLTNTTRRFPLLRDVVRAARRCALVVVLSHLHRCCEHIFLLVHIRVGKLCGNTPFVHYQNTISHRHSFR